MCASQEGCCLVVRVSPGLMFRTQFINLTPHFAGSHLYAKNRHYNKRFCSGDVWLLPAHKHIHKRKGKLYRLRRQPPLWVSLCKSFRKNRTFQVLRWFLCSGKPPQDHAENSHSSVTPLSKPTSRHPIKTRAHKDHVLAGGNRRVQGGEGW